MATGYTARRKKVVLTIKEKPEIIDKECHTL